jgi:malonyl-CoA/methylmalonyl-CoA synthetase
MEASPSTVLHRVLQAEFTPGWWARADAPGDRIPGERVLGDAASFACALGDDVARERVLLRGALGPAWAAAFVGLALARARVVPVARSAAPPELAHVAADVGAKFSVDVDEPACRVAVGVEPLDPSRRAAADRSSIERALARIDPADPALVVYTSGTTGSPKGAILTHANLATHTRVLRDAWAVTDRDTLLHALPMHHVHGITVAFLTALAAGANVLYAPKFEAAAALEAMRAATLFMAVPTMWARIVDAIEMGARPDGLARLRLFTSGSAALPASIATRVRAIAGAIPLERYGMTEIGMALSNPLEPSKRKLGSVGVPLPTVEARIVDDAGVEVAGPGALEIRGPSVFAGYWGKDPGIDFHERADGAPPRGGSSADFRDDWFRTGDVAERDAGGAYRLLGRASVDILKTGGEKVSALEIEEMLREHPSIAEVAVIGMPDEEWGERVVAVIVPRGAPTAEEIRAFAKTRVAPFKVPKEVLFVEELPRNAMGKVQKSRLRGPA